MGNDSAHILDVTLDNIQVDGLTPERVKAEFANIKLGPGPVNFSPSGPQVTVADHRGGGAPVYDCAERFSKPWTARTR
jgi:hypothetical protein